MSGSGAVGQQVVMKTVLMLVDDKEEEIRMAGGSGRHVKAGVWRCE